MHPEPATAETTAAGRLVIAGTGIRAIAQLTLETAAWIEAADIVCHALADPFTQQWVEQRAVRAEDLSQLYSEDTTRLVTYADMALRLVSHARAGLTVVGLFYGHPGVFTSPSHWAIAAARAEGIEAVMLPGVSAQDCLYADLGVDPGSGAEQSFEATEMMLRGREPSPHAHVVIWQIGVIAQRGYTSAPKRPALAELTDHLLRFYPGDHEVTHYRGAQTVLGRPVIRRLRLADLPGEATAVTSTLYVPAVGEGEFDMAAAAKLGLDDEAGAQQRPGSVAEVAALADDRSDAASPLHPPDWYRPLPQPPGRLQAIVAALSTDPALLVRFRSDPVLYLTAAGLDTVEVWAALSGDEAWIAQCARSGSGAAAAVALGAAANEDEARSFAIAGDGRLVRRRR